MISNIVKNKNHESYEFVVAMFFIEKLLRRFLDFTLIIDHDSFESVEDDIRNYEFCATEKLIRINVFHNAAKAIQKK